MSKHRFTSRTKARKRAVDVVFEADQRGMGRNPDILRDLLAQRREVTAALTPLPEYSVRIVTGVADNLRRIDDLISDHARVAGLDRMAAVDLAVLRVATWEMLGNSEEVPAPAAIDEAVSIVKSVSTDSSPAFVNAVLDAIRKDLAAPAWSRERVAEHAPRTEDVPSEEPAPQETQDLPEPPTGATTAGSGEDTTDEDDQAAPTEAPQGTHPTLSDLTSADLETLDELLDEY